MRLAVATQYFKQPLRRAVVTAAACGATGVQFDARNELKQSDYGETARRQLQHELSERGLKIASLTFPTRHALHAEEYLDTRIAAVRDAMHFAALLKAPVLIVRCGRIPSESAAHDRQRLHEILDDFARLGNHLGVTLSLTPAAEPPDALAALLDGIKSGPIGIDFDPGTCAIAGRSAVDDLRTLHRFVAHVQARDAIRDVDGSGQETVLGRGEVDWPGLLASITEIEYRGWLTIRRTQGDDPVGDSTRAVQYIRNVAYGG
jgi:sugar phosphate isomerase/epimerase